jgi:hypothetical protein
MWLFLEISLLSSKTELNCATSKEETSIHYQVTLFSDSLFNTEGTKDQLLNTTITLVLTMTKANRPGNTTEVT